MKRRYAVFLIVLLLFLCGCGQKSNKYGFDVVTSAKESSTDEKTTTDGNEDATSGVADSQGTFMEYVTQGAGMSEKLGVEKTLVFIADITAISGVDPRIYERFNELLVNKYGCDLR